MDLSAQFRSEVTCQIYPFDSSTSERDQLCHVYSSTALAEAACFRRLKKHIDLSESLVLAGHYLDQSFIKNQALSETDLFSFLQPRERRPSPLLNPVRGTSALEWDAGSSYSNLLRMNKGYLCEERSYRTLRSMDQLIETYRSLFTQFLPLQSWYIEQTSPSEARRLISLHAAQGLQQVLKKDLASLSATDAAQECLKEPFVIEQKTYSREQGMDLLKKGFPWICTAGAVYDDKKSKIISLDAQSSGHALVVVGVQDGRWLVRDSISSAVLPVSGDCQSMVWIH